MLLCACACASLSVATCSSCARSPVPSTELCPSSLSRASGVACYITARVSAAPTGIFASVPVPPQCPCAPISPVHSFHQLQRVRSLWFTRAPDVVRAGVVSLVALMSDRLRSAVYLTHCVFAFAARVVVAFVAPALMMLAADVVRSPSSPPLSFHYQQRVCSLLFTRARGVACACVIACRIMFGRLSVQHPLMLALCVREAAVVALVAPAITPVCADAVCTPPLISTAVSSTRAAAVVRARADFARVRRAVAQSAPADTC